MSDKIRWAILGPGGIAVKFAQALAFNSRTQLVAVGSRNLLRAQAFASQFNIPRAYGSYADLLKDDQVDIVYIATPHNGHCENAILAMQNGKHVLCEKPLAVNAVEAQAMIKTARDKNLFCMEAMWTRFLPMIQQVSELVNNDTIGNLRFLSADFGFKADAAEKSRIIAPELAGGALLDVGVYPISLASMFLGSPRKIACAMNFASTGVDELDSLILSYENHSIAQLMCSCNLATPSEATIIGEKGSIRIHSAWWRGNKYTLKLNDASEKFVEVPSHENGFVYEIAHVHEMLDLKKIESPIMPLGETLDIAKIMDTIRNRFGLKYPFEPESPRAYFV